MKKKQIVLCILVLLLIAYPSFTYIFSNHLNQKNHDNNQSEVFSDGFLTSSIPQVEWSDQSCQDKLSLLERLIMLNYAPQIIEAVNNYYQDLRGFDLDYITDVRAVAPYEYEAKIQISTYVGAHNPPYGLDVVTIHFKHLRDGTVVNYEHKDDN